MMVLTDFALVSTVKQRSTVARPEDAGKRATQPTTAARSRTNEDVCPAATRSWKSNFSSSIAFQEVLFNDLPVLRFETCATWWAGGRSYRERTFGWESKRFRSKLRYWYCPTSKKRCRHRSWTLWSKRTMHQTYTIACIRRRCVQRRTSIKRSSYSSASTTVQIISERQAQPLRNHSLFLI